MLAQIINPPSGKDDFYVWASHHAAHHRAILDKVAREQELTLDSFALDPMPDFTDLQNQNDKDAMNNWLEWHQAMHTQMNKVFNIVSGDLSELEWDNKQQVNAWFAQNYVEHLATGVG